MLCIDILEYVFCCSYTPQWWHGSVILDHLICVCMLHVTSSTHLSKTLKACSLYLCHQAADLVLSKEAVVLCGLEVSSRLRERFDLLSTTALAHYRLGTLEVGMNITL